MITLPDWSTQIAAQFASVASIDGVTAVIAAMIAIAILFIVINLFLGLMGIDLSGGD